MVGARSYSGAVSTSPGSITVGSAVVALLATWPRRILVGSVILIPMIVWAAGGLRPAEIEPRSAPLGESIDTGAWDLVLRSAFVSDQLDVSGLAEGEHWVGVVATFTNQGMDPINPTFSDPTFELPDVPNESVNPYEVIRLDLGRRLSDAQPGLVYDVALLWRASAPPPGETILVSVQETASVEMAIQPGYFLWRGTGQELQAQVPVGPVPASIPLAEEP